MYREIYGKELTHSHEGGEVPQSAQQAGDPGESIFQFKSRGKKPMSLFEGRQAEGVHSYRGSAFLFFVLFQLLELGPFCPFKC